MKSRIIFVVLLILLNPKFELAQWAEPQTLQATVLIEKESGQPQGTGFLLYDYENTGSYIVVTCSHLIGANKRFLVRVNADTAIINYLRSENIPAIVLKNVKSIVAKESVTIIVDLYDSDGSKLFVQDTSLDIAAFYLSNFNVEIKTDTATNTYKAAKILGIPMSYYAYRKELSLGDEVYFVGFPFGIGASNLIEPLIRSGSIAWMSKNSQVFLLDAFSYGGNSGSPIFQKIILGAEPGSMKWKSPKLVGMITSHQGLKLDNILTQPNPNELKFEKGSVELNFGLARCVYLDDILNVVSKLNK